MSSASALAPVPASPTVGRAAYVDWARGLAVVIMIEAHTIDAWTRVADRKTALFGYLTILGGFAAPLFLCLAGTSVALSVARTFERSGRRAAAVEAVCRRGLEIFILAFLFRLQAFIVTPGSHPVTLFRVDVLNVMGPAIVAASIVWGAARRVEMRVFLYASLAALVAMTTPIVRAASWVDRLPTWVQWYVRPAGDLTTFTLLPWAAFVFAGSAVGALIASARSGEARRRLRMGLWLGGAALVAGGFNAASRESIYAVQVSFWTSSPTWFAIRTGIMLLALALLAAIPEFGEFVAARGAVGHRGDLKRMSSELPWTLSWQAPLARLGRASLFVYWIHVELVYGYASWLWRRRLPVLGSVAAWMLFTALIHQVIVVRDRYFARYFPRAAVSFPRRAGLSQA
jgi:uncharacterized membrane protein